MTLSEQLAFELLEQLNPVLDVLRTRRALLADQLERAATSVALNLAECRARVGRDRLRVMRLAAAEAHEVKAGLTVARTLRHVDAATLAAPDATVDRLAGVLYGLLRALG